MLDKIIVDGNHDIIRRFRDDMLENLYAVRSEAIFSEIDSNYEVQENAKKVRRKSEELYKLIAEISDDVLRNKIESIYTQVSEERNDVDSFYHRGFYCAGIKDGIKMF